MKVRVAIPMITAVIVLAGCKSKEHQSSFVVDDSRELHAAMLDDIWADHTESAIARGAAVYPYHFVLNSAQLNELGEYEVGVLARTGAANIHLARGDASDALYEARKNALVDALVSGGADASMIAINDTLPGGEGMASTRVRTNAETESSQMKPVYGAAMTSE